MGSYYAQYLFAIRLVLSLRRVHTTLPISLLVSGTRVPRMEQMVTRLGVKVVEGVNISRPAWARTWHLGSFSTLALVSLVQFERVIFLENDAVVTRNIDHLASAPAPSFANHFDDFECDELAARDSEPQSRMSTEHATRHATGHPKWRTLPNGSFPAAIVALRVTLMAGLAVLAPSASEWDRMRQLLNQTSSKWPLASGDGGSQTIWRLFYPSYHELPVGYA